MSRVSALSFRTFRSRSLIAPLAALAFTLASVGCGASADSPPTTEPTTAAVATVSIANPAVSVAVGATAQLSAVTKDANGNTLTGRTVTWTTSSGSVASVNGSGLVTGVAVGTATITATSETKTATATVTVTATSAAVASLTLTPTASVAVGATTTLVATPKDAAGNALSGRVVTFASSDNAKATVNGSGVVTGVAVGTATITATSETKTATSLVTVTSSSTGTLVVSGPTLNMGSATCGITSANAAYCWGFGGNGETGSTVGSSTTPVPVQGGLSFATLSSFSGHVCALTPVGDAYCWGSGGLGGLGDGNINGHLSSVPVPVVGGFKFKMITVGTSFACALTADGTAYCWGDNRQGQLGLGAVDATAHGTPTVMPNFKWQSISARSDAACGVTTAGAAYCWGWSSGVIGSGSGANLTAVAAPSLVPGGITLKSVVATSNDAACGLTADGKAYCWGVGSLGNGTSGTINAAGMTAVSGGLTFTQMAASNTTFCGVTTTGETWCWGGGFGNSPTLTMQGIVASQVATRGVATCVIATDGKAYCLGSNFLGELGDGTNTTRATATPVLGGLTFKLQ